MIARKGLGTEIAWAGGSVATGIATNIMALYGLYYLSKVLGFSPLLAGSLLLVGKLYDAAVDPLIGGVTDSSRRGSRPFLLPGIVLVSAAIAAFFNLHLAVPNGGVAGAALALIVLLALSSGYAIFSIPYLAMPPAFTEGYDQRTRLMSMRVAFAMVGVLLSSVAAPILVGKLGGGGDSYGTAGIVLAAIMLVSGSLVWIRTKGIGASPGERAAPTLRYVMGSYLRMFSVMQLQPFRVLTLAKLVQLTVLAIILATTPYFFTFVLGMQQQAIGSYLGVFSIASLASIVIWRFAVKRFGKRQVFVTGLVLYGLGLASWYFYVPGEPTIFRFVRAVLLGSTSAGTLVCTLSMLPDTMEYDRLVTGQAREGLMSGAFAFVEKFAGALGPFVVGAALQSAGLPKAESLIAPSPHALETIRWAMSVIPSALTLLCAALVLRYPLDARMLEEARITKRAPDIEPGPVCVEA